MNDATDFATARRDDPDGSRRTATTLTASDSPSPSSGDIALGSMSFDSVAVWVNEGGAGGEVIR